MFVSHQAPTVKHLWVDLHDEVDRFVFWQYICHLRFMCQEVRCALGSIRWLISVLWDTLPCLLYFKWQKMLFLALPAGIHTPFVIVYIFLPSEDEKEFAVHIQRRTCRGTAPRERKAQFLCSFTLAPSICFATGASALVACETQEHMEYIFRHSAQLCYNLYNLQQINTLAISRKPLNTYALYRGRANP